MLCRHLRFLLVILIVPTSVASAQQTAFQEIEPGLSYAHIVKPEGPQSIHVLKVQREKAGWHWTTGLGDGRVYGLAATPTIAKFVSSGLNARPLAAINGDFYAIARGNYQGDPLGLQIVEGEIVSAPSNRGCVWFDATGQPNMGLVESKFRVLWPDGQGDTPVGLNEPRGDGAAVLFTPSMAHNPRDVAKYEFSTRTTDGKELLLEPVEENAWHPLQVGKTYRARVASIRAGGNSPITKKSVILSLGPKLHEKVPALKIGDTLTIKLETTPDLSGTRNAIGGGERLLADGKVATDGKSKDRHPRSIIGWNKEHLCLVVVDGRAPKVAIGMTYLELANLALSLGCKEALNLDGGGSSTLWADGKVLNTPSDGTTRLVANALVLVEMKR
jgi:large repetitive protein